MEILTLALIDSYYFHPTKEMTKKLKICLSILVIVSFVSLVVLNMIDSSISSNQVDAINDISQTDTPTSMLKYNKIGEYCAKLIYFLR